MSILISGNKSKNRETRNVAGLTLTLLLLFSAFAIIETSAQTTKTTVTAPTGFYPNIGVNSPTLLSWQPMPTASNPLLFAPYKGQTSVWANAKVTFTRPDGTTDIINGPFKSRPELFQGRQPDVVLVYTPNMKGKWLVNFYWPGDSLYNAINRTDSFTVGEHYPKRDTFAYLSMNPYPAVGIGQNLLVNAWVTPPPYTARDFYEGYLFTFTSPSGSTFNVGPMNSECPGTVWFDLPLNEVGNWTIKFSFPGDHLSLPSSVTRSVQVQKTAIPGYPDSPLPSGQWSFPINTENRELRNIAGPWYQANYNASQGAWNPYTEAPRTAHILWKAPSEGQIGGYIGSPHSIQTGGGQSMYDAGDAGIFA